MSYNVMLEGLISDMGGCGRFQWILSSIMHLSKTIATWSMLHMSFIGQEPKFFCESNGHYPNGTVYDTTYDVSERSCFSVNDSECIGYRFEDDMHTVVSEWDLVCDRKWIVATITTIQMGGVMVGCFVAGHLGDWIGRKPTYYLALLILIVFNIVAYFSVSWQMYAAARFMLGSGVGSVISVIYNHMSEFTTSIWRPVILAVPSWASEASIFALVCWLLKDWKNIHLTSACFGAPFLLSWWFIQESFRWLITKGRYKDAETVVERVAKINGYEKPDISEIINHVKREHKTDTTRKRYSAIDLFRTKKGAIRTSALLFIWMGVSYAYYGLTFGVQFMKGNLYLNMFIINAVEIPGNLVAIVCMNKFGRKWTTIFGLVFTGLCGVGDGVLQYVDTSANDVLINVFAVGSRLGNDLGWGALAVMTMEMHPTVIRATAYGVVNTAARVGGMIAPQIVFLNDEVPGLLFFLNAGIMFISALLCLMFEETKDHILEDSLHKQDNNQNNEKQPPASDDNGLTVSRDVELDINHDLNVKTDVAVTIADTNF